MPSRLSLLLPAALAVATGCLPADPSAVDVSRDLDIDFADPTLRRIAELQDRMAADSLLDYFDAAEPERRYLAARAFGSLRADSAVGPLIGLLADPILEVRTMAAYALGQQGAPEAAPALTEAFERFDTAGFYAPFHRALLEAIGKVGDTAALRALATVSTYRPRDTMLQLGRVQGLYRMGLRGIASAAGTEAALLAAVDEALPREVRLYGAHYGGRVAAADVSAYADELLRSLTPAVIGSVGGEGDVDLAVALSRALGQTGDTVAGLAIPRLLAGARDVRVRVALLRAAGRLPLADAGGLLRRAALDTSAWVARTAAEQLLARGTPAEATLYWRMARDSVSRAARPAMYAAALRHLPSAYGEYRNYINGELRRAVAAPAATAADRYYHADLLRAMAEWPFTWRYLVERAFDPERSAAERTAAAEALDAIAKRDDIVAYLRGSLRTFRREYADYFRRVFASDDVSLQAVAAGTIATPGLDFAAAFDGDVGAVLAQAQSRLKLPRDTEAYYALDEARAYFDAGHEAAREPPAYNHAVNWDIYRSLQPGLRVAIETPRGEILVDLLEQEAPATVVNFVQLVRTGFYNGQGFHRVVPSFVTQGGDPRGDGYGGLDFTIRTETPPLYYDAPGYLGMASAGPHTEGVQFFFTHVAAPHLDGRYTIFGRVVEGMDVVLALERGDEMRMRLR